jgi:FMN phosphatase YigB (HAD superfamily)
VSAGRRVTLFDLFGTLITFDASHLPEVVVDGRRVRSTLGVWGHLVDETLPALGVEGFARAVFAASIELDEERRGTTIEFSSRERFRRALRHAGCDEGRVDELAPLFARAHMAEIAKVTRFPDAHRAVLAHARARGGVAVITNFDDTGTAHEILGRHGIRPQVDTVVVSEAIGLRKPHPALVRIALRELAAAPRDAVMIGDHPVEDVGAAAGAGVDAIWIDADGKGVVEGRPVPRWIVRALPEVVPLLD